VPLPFVHMEAPMYVKGEARRGPTFGETLLVHAVARLALHPELTNIQASWVKLGPDGAREVLRAGVNDLGGTLMNESISRAAGAAHGQELPPEEMEALIRSAGRIPRQRTTLYDDAPEERRRASFGAAPLAEPLNPPVRDAGLKAPPRLVRPGLAAAAR
jgi:FO synthase